jgi:HAE1 family hydrophobic/amphiphilic exporter-1
LVLAIWLVVDDAIVVDEAVEHHIEEGMTPRGYPEGDGGGLQSGDRDRLDPRGGVHSHRVFIPGITAAIPAFAVTIAIS